MAGINRLWRIKDGETDGGIDNVQNEIVEFDEATPANNQQYFKGLKLEISIDISQTNALKGDINPSQDNGVGSVRVYINGVIKGKGSLTERKKLIKWAMQDKTTTDFPHGRFGTVLVNMPEMDIEPDGDADTGFGWLIEDFEVSKEGEFDNKVMFSMTLKHNGNKSGIIANL